VFMDVGPAQPRISNIRVDYVSGIRQAVQHLAALCHQHIAFISGPLRLRSALARRDAFVQSLAEIGFEADAIVESDHTIQGGMAALDKLLAQSRRPTAIMCSNDLTAIGVMRGSYARKITIPRELSVIGFDDIRLSEFVLPPLTTVQMSQAELARLAFYALLADVQRESPSATGTEYRLKTSLILRDSTARAPVGDTPSNSAARALEQD
jgi:LacI family transcriptional regulator